MAQSQIIGKVSSIIGEAFVRESDGKLRHLKVGDVIREGESVVTSNGSQVLLVMADGREVSVHPGEVVRIDADIATPIKPDATDTTVVHHDKDSQTIAQVLAKGGSLDALLEQDAPAAGAAATGENDGHTFVEVLRVVESIDPLALLPLDAGAGRVPVVEQLPSAFVNTFPAITVDAPNLTNDSTPHITGTTDVADGTTVTLVVTDAHGATQTFSA
ncbi:retention module-containing protein, partial [Rhodoferax sp.]|uniref:retention module-containing protein n=1 Tax=Rhodoferax sp. TaxID=50421 RepID=UPI002848EFDB